MQPERNARAELALGPPPRSTPGSLHHSCPRGAGPSPAPPHTLVYLELLLVVSCARLCLPELGDQPEDGDPLLHPLILVVRLIHRAGEQLEAALNVSHRRFLEFAVVLVLDLLALTRLAFFTDALHPARAQQHTRHLLHVRLHYILITEDVTHLPSVAVRILPVARIRTVVARLLVVDADGRPTSRTRAAGVLSTHRISSKVDVAKRHIAVARQRLRDIVPRWRLLCSSASALRGDPTNKEGLASVHLRFDEAFEISRCEFGRARPVSVRVDAGGEQGRDEEHHARLNSRTNSQNKLSGLKYSTVHVFEITREPLLTV